MRGPIVDVFIEREPYDRTTNWSSDDREGSDAARCSWNDPAVLRDAGIRHRIKALAETAGSMRKLGRLAGISENLVSSIVRGDQGTTTIETLEKIAAAMKVSFDYLVTGRSGAAADFGLDLARHPHPTFAPAAQALLDLHGADERSIAVVRDFLSAHFEGEAAWPSDDWFDHLRDEYRRRQRGLVVTLSTNR